MVAQPRSLYSQDDPQRFIELFRAASDENRAKVDAWYRKPISNVESLLDAYYSFASEHVWTFHFVRPDPTAKEQLLFSAVHKNQTALFACLELIRSGFVGPARPLLRQIFEAQIMAKFAALSATDALAEQWLAEEPVIIGRSVFPKILRPDPQPLKMFWNILHRFVHASPGSQQVSPFAEDNQDEIGITLMLLALVLHNQYHLLAVHAFSRRSKSYARVYSKPDAIQGLRDRIQQIHKAESKHFSAEGKALVRTFRARWVLSR